MTRTMGSCLVSDLARQAGPSRATVLHDERIGLLHGRRRANGYRVHSEATLPAPMPLSHPQGWIAQSLTDAPLTPVKGPAACVSRFDSPDLW